MKRLLFIGILGCCCVLNFAQTKVTISNPETWKASDLSNFVGQTIQFTTPFYVCNNYYNNKLIISPRRIFIPTNQAYPQTTDYQSIVAANNSGTITLNNINDYHRMGEKIVNLTVKVNSTSSLTPIGTQTFVGNKRSDLATPPSVGDYSLLVCAMNLEYYLITNFGTGFGPDNAAESAKQHTKIVNALATINADIYGLVEIEQGQAALKKLASALTTATGRNFTYINDGGSVYSSYTKAGFIYCTDKVEPYGQLQGNNTATGNRKKLQAFVEKKTGEKFIFSLNHFKAKSGTGTGDDADKGDGQGVFNATRLQEAKSVITTCDNKKSYFSDEDILIMGDLNAYAKEDPIKAFTQAGYYDLHRAFHADSSYSYVFHGEAGYLDHALANKSMYEQITGMCAYHINSDEHDKFTYDKSNDQTMFRSSDHDPILVGLRLGEKTNIMQTFQNRIRINTYEFYNGTAPLTVEYANNAYMRIYSVSGIKFSETRIPSDNYQIDTSNFPSGIYIMNLYGENGMKQVKFIVK